LRVYVAPFVLLTVALIAETCLIFENGAGVVGGFISKVLLGILGGISYIVPIGMLFIAFFYGDLKANSALKFKYISLGAFAIFFAAAQSALADPQLGQRELLIKECYQNGALHQGGGVLGCAMGKLLAMAMGSTGAAIIAIILCVFSITFFVGISPVGIWKYVIALVGNKRVSAYDKKMAQKEEKSRETAVSAIDDTAESHTTIAFTPSKRSFSTTISNQGMPASEYDSYSGNYESDSYRPSDSAQDVGESAEEKLKAAQKAKSWASYGSDFSDNESVQGTPRQFAYSDIPAYVQADNPMTAQSSQPTIKVIPTNANSAANGGYSPVSRSSQNSVNSAMGNKTYQSGASYNSRQSAYGQPKKEEKPRAYSPFANPLMTKEDFIKGNTSPASTASKKTSSAPPQAYSPFSDPLLSMNTPQKSRTSTPQAYIANNAVEKYVSAEAVSAQKGAGSIKSEQISTPVSESSGTKNDPDSAPSNTEIKPIQKSPFIDITSVASPVEATPEKAEAEEKPAKPAKKNVSIAVGTSVGNTQMDDDECTYDDGDENDEVSENEATTEPASPYLSMTSPATSVLGRSVSPMTEDDDDSSEEEGDEGAEGEYSFYTYKEKRYPNYVYPKFDLLEPQQPNNTITEDEIMEVQQKLIDKLHSLRVDVSLSGYSIGPSVTRYELTPGPGVKVKNITSLTEDIALSLGSEGVRISTVPGKAVVGVEVPNKKVTVVSLRSLIESKDFINAKSKITVCVGLTVTGKPVYMDIDDMPHVLIAGQTKSGKSVAINCMLLSLLYRASPDEVQLILIDPKRVELNVYSKLPHLVMPVIDDPQRAAAALRWAVAEMERRYKLLDKMCVRNREEYYELKDENPDFEYLPQIVIVIDELADLMLQVREHVEELINRLAAKARACGIHLLIGTQRPSVDIITGLIKANIPARISFKVSSNNDSRIILGNVGAERLLGKGDMIYHPTGGSQKRVQGAYVDGKEIKRIMNYITDNNGSARFDPEVIYQLDSEVEKMNKSNKKSMDDEEEGVIDCSDIDFDYLCQAIELSIELQQVATNAIQRRLKIGFNRAANLVDRMEELGFISKRNGSKPRDVLVTWDTYNQWKSANAK